MSVFGDGGDRDRHVVTCYNIISFRTAVLFLYHFHKNAETNRIRNVDRMLRHPSYCHMFRVSNCSNPNFTVLFIVHAKGHGRSKKAGVRGGLCSEKNIATADTLITLSTLMIILKSERYDHSEI
jgi:hypothetical protein